MFDANYFKKTLNRDVEVSGGSPVVEIVLLSGHVYRVRTVVETTEGHVTLECYQMKGDLAHQRPRFGGDSSAPYETFRAVVSYESVASVVLDATEISSKVRTGFG
jgi:hypothetical protein